MKRILLTGGTGFIGRQVVGPLLQKGFEVHLAVPPGEAAAAARGGVVVHPCDLFDAKATGDLLNAVRPSHLMHLAWYVVHGQFWTSPENHRWVKVSLDLLRAFMETGGRRAVMAGTCAEYDWSAGLCRENDTPLRPRTLYGRCKKELCESAEALANAGGCSLAWGRVFLLYGPGKAPARLIPSIILPLLRGERAACRSGRQVRDLLHVSDVGGAFAALADSDVRGAVNIASGCPVRLGEVAGMIADILGKQALLEVGECEPTPDNPASILADVARLNEQVGWRPTMGLVQGLRQAIDEWKRWEGNANH